MGSLSIDRCTTIDVDDEMLAHLFTVLIAKLRRREPVVLSWVNAADRAEQAFLTAASTISAEFEHEERPALDRPWLERMMVAANSTSGICLTTAAVERERGGVPTLRRAQVQHSAASLAGVA